MHDYAKLTAALQEAGEALERLACGERGLLPNDTNGHDIAALLVEVQRIAELVEDETNRRMTRLDDSEIEDVIDGWLDAADKVDSRRGEVA
jgi:hypothetical protein